MAKKPAFLAVDFFSGAGGTTCGLIEAGGYVIAGIDKDPACVETYEKNNQNNSLDKHCARYILRDIFPASQDYPGGEQHIIFSELTSLIDKYKKQASSEVPLLFAICAPCQPFTTISKKEMSQKRIEKRTKDRNLLQEACKFVKKFKPDIILAENVAGASKDQFGNVWQSLDKNLRTQGYITGTKVICTSKFGVPQYRKRSILLAIKKTKITSETTKKYISKNIIHVPESDPNSKILSVKEAIGYLPAIKAGEKHSKIPNHVARHLNDLNLKRISVAKPGESNSYLEHTIYGDLSLPCQKRAKQKHKQPCFTDVYTRMSPDRPSPTITTKCYSISNGRFGHYDQSQNRGISLREAAILQSFPDNYIFYSNSIGVIARMIGNAAPPKLAKFYAKYLLNLASSE